MSGDLSLYSSKSEVQFKKLPKINNTIIQQIVIILRACPLSRTGRWRYITATCSERHWVGYTDHRGLGCINWDFEYEINVMVWLTSNEATQLQHFVHIYSLKKVTKWSTDWAMPPRFPPPGSLKILPLRTANLVKMSNWNSQYETAGALDNWASGIFAFRKRSRPGAPLQRCTPLAGAPCTF